MLWEDSTVLGMKLLSTPHRRVGSETWALFSIKILGMVTDRGGLISY